MKRLLVSLSSLLLMGMLAGCQFMPVYTSKKVCIDWVDAIKINNIRYFNGNGQVITDEKIIDKEIGTVKFKVADNVNDPEYKLKDGDATFLEPGTKIFSVKGYDKDKVAAVKVGVQWILYTAEGSTNLVQDNNDDYKNATKLVVDNFHGKTLEIEEKDKIESIAKVFKDAPKISQMPSFSNEKRFSFYFVVKDKDGVGKIATKYYLTYQDIDTEGYIENRNDIFKVENTINKILTEGF